MNFTQQRKDEIEQQAKDSGLAYSRVVYSWPWVEFYDDKGRAIKTQQES